MPGARSPCGKKQALPYCTWIEPLFAMHKAVKEMMEVFMREGCSTNAIADRLTPFDEFNKFVGLQEVVARQKRFEQD
jgi:2,3-dimethylmalate lyase